MLLMLGQIRILSDILQFAQTIILKIVRERERERKMGSEGCISKFDHQLSTKCILLP